MVEQKGTYRKRWKARFSALILGILLLFPGCSKKDSSPSMLEYGLITMLLRHRLTVLLKATYASDRPLDYSEINNNQLFQDPDDTNLETPYLPSYSDLPFFLDVGEIRLSSKSPLDELILIDSQEKSEDFWDIVSTTRQVYCNQLYSTIREFDGCLDTGGLVNFQNLMNGEGAEYPSNDVGPASYLHSGVFFRAILTGWSWEGGDFGTASFDNNKVRGENIMPLSNYNPGISALEKQLYVPQFFPLHYKTEVGEMGGMHLDESQTYAVLEIRFNMKENMMVHGFTNSSGKHETMVGFSDWKVNHQNHLDLGGNVISRGRIFYPDFTRDLVIDGGTKSNRHYYAVYYESACHDMTNPDNVVCDTSKIMPIVATPVRDGDDNRLTDLNEGDYVLQCRYDETYDGYPEKVLSEIKFRVNRGPGVDHISCACGHSTTSGCN